jgi:hypothetical protein
VDGIPSVAIYLIVVFIFICVRIASARKGARKRGASPGGRVGGGSLSLPDILKRFMGEEVSGGGSGAGASGGGGLPPPPRGSASGSRGSSAASPAARGFPAAPFDAPWKSDFAFDEDDEDEAEDEGLIAGAAESGASVRVVLPDASPVRVSSGVVCEMRSAPSGTQSVLEGRLPVGEAASVQGDRPPAPEAGAAGGEAFFARLSRLGPLSRAVVMADVLGKPRGLGGE